MALSHPGPVLDQSRPPMRAGNTVLRQVSRHSEKVETEWSGEGVKWERSGSDVCGVKIGLSQLAFGSW